MKAIVLSSIFLGLCIANLGRILIDIFVIAYSGGNDGTNELNVRNYPWIAIIIWAAITALTCIHLFRSIQSFEQTQ